MTRCLLSELDGELRESSGSVEGVDLERDERLIGSGHVGTSRRERANAPDVTGSRTAIPSQSGPSPGKVPPCRTAKPLRRGSFLTSPPRGTRMSTNGARWSPLCERPTAAAASAVHIVTA